MDYHLIDDTHIEILAGDIARGLWSFANDVISRDGEPEVRLRANTSSMEVRLKRQIGKLDTMSNLPISSFVAVALTTVMGPAGGLASQAVAFVAGKDDFLCIGATLKDGRKFIAYMRNSVFDEWCKACPDAKQIEEKKKKDKGLFGMFGF